MRAQPAVVAQLAVAFDASVDRARQVRREIAGIETGEHRIRLPFQPRRPCNVAARVQSPLRHAGLQLAHDHAAAVADAVEIHMRGFAAALQCRLADRRPALERAGDAEVRVAGDHRRAVIAVPAQAVRVDREFQRRVVGIAQIGASLRGDAAVEHVQHQRLQTQYLFVQLQFRWLQGRAELALGQVAAQVCLAADAVRSELEGKRRGSFAAAGQQADVQCLAIGAQRPLRRVLIAAQAERGAQRRRRAATDRHDQVRQIAARQQADARRGLSGRCGQHGGGQQVGAEVVARLVVAMHAEAAAIAVHLQVVDVQLALTGIQPGARAADLDQRLAFLQHLQAIDAHVIRLQRQRWGDLWQHLGPGRQLERRIAARQLQRCVGDLQRIQPQGAAKQRADRRIQHHRLRLEHDAPHRAAGARRGLAVRIALARHREMHVAQGHRPGHRPVCGGPGQLRIGGQARHDFLQQCVAAADRHQQPVQQ